MVLLIRQENNLKKKRMMLRGPLIPPVTKSKVRSTMQKVMSFLVGFAKKASSKGEGGEESVRKLQKAFSEE